MTEVTFTVPGPPRGKARPRFTKQGRAYTPKETQQYENEIAIRYKLAARGQTPAPRHSPVDVRIRAFYPIPESDTLRQKQRKLTGIIRPCIKPDLDNVGKAVLDALNKVAWEDDTQVVDFQIRKFYSDHPRLEVSVRDAEHKEDT